MHKPSNEGKRGHRAIRDGGIMSIDRKPKGAKSNERNLLKTKAMLHFGIFLELFGRLHPKIAGLHQKAKACKFTTCRDLVKSEFLVHALHIPPSVEPNHLTKGICHMSPLSFLTISFFLIFLGITNPWSVSVAQTQNHEYLQDYNQSTIVPGVVIVKMSSMGASRSNQTTAGSSSLDRKLLDVQAGAITPLFPHHHASTTATNLSPFLQVEIPKSADPLSVAQTLSADPSVEYAEPVYADVPCVVPNDPSFEKQNFLTQIQSELAWNLRKGDKSVIIAIVDSGIDYQHEDLVANAWTNEAESRGQPGVDDDNNGFVDDIYGWDFGENDADPTCSPPNQPYAGHGTHCAGIAAAVTDNNIGVAGVSWNCQFMSVKVKPDNSPWFTESYKGIVYAAENGADIISCSFGSFMYSRFRQEIIDYVHSLGVIVVAAAGNENHTGRLYPASYEHVVSVASVHIDDSKAKYSSYGPAIDISAPGGDGHDRIYSTIPENSYKRFSGTSMATPVVAGVCGLVKIANPEWSNDRIIRHLLMTADNIDPKNPDYENQLGYGRVNPYRALSSPEQAAPPPELQLVAYSFSDAFYGNNNRILEHGETALLRVTLRNFSIGGHESLTFHLASHHSNLEIVTPRLGPVVFAADTSKSFEFQVRMRPEGAAANVTLTLNVNGASGYASTHTLQTSIGKTPILLVDHDLSSGYEDLPNIEAFYIDLLKRHHLEYTLWDTDAHGFPEFQTLQHYPLVIVSLGVYGRLNNASVRNALEHYLDAGGNLFIGGQMGLYSLYEMDGSAHALHFAQEYLHVEHESLLGGNRLYGVPGDPVSQDLEFNIYQPLCNSAQQWPAVLRPVNGGEPLFTYFDDKVSAIKYDGEYKMVYLGFGLEAVDSDRHTAFGDYSLMRDEVFTRLLSWFSFIQHTPLTDTEDISLARTVKIQLLKNSMNPSSLMLYWRRQGEEKFHETEMSELEKSTYVAKLPAPHAQTTIEYYIQARNAYYSWRHPIGGPTIAHRIHVGPDTEPPQISNISNVPHLLSTQIPNPVRAIVTDNTAMDSKNVFIEYKVHNTNGTSSIRTVPMNLDSDSTFFIGELAATFAVGDTVAYRIRATDDSNAKNTGYSEWLSFLMGWEDFENGLNRWSFENDTWRLAYAHENYYIKHAVERNYPLNADISLTLTDGVDLSHVENAELRFSTIYTIEEGKDFGYIELQAEKGAPWIRLDVSVTGYNRSEWKDITVPLRHYVGPGFDDVRIRFRFVSDSTQSRPMRGWYLDNIRILPTLPSAPSTQIERDEQAPNQFQLYANHPNPFNGKTAISYDLPFSTHVRIIVFDILGRQVKELKNEHQASGQHRVVWDATDANGQRVATGLYFYQMETTPFSAVRKMVLVQ